MEIGKKLPLKAVHFYVPLTVPVKYWSHAFNELRRIFEDYWSEFKAYLRFVTSNFAHKFSLKVVYDQFKVVYS